MANKLFDQVGGTITAKLKGKNEEKVINMALTRGIYLWDIKKTEDGMNMKVRSSGFRALQNIAAENNYELDVVTKEGLPFYRNLIKRRMGFIGGALIFIMALYLMTSFIWSIDISGSHNVDRKKILLTAAKYGVYQGAAKWSFSRSEMEQGMLRDISELAYVELDVQGVKAHIKVVEKILPKNEITGPCHMVATKDGVIDYVLVLEGQANVKPGDVVGKGDILISGIIIPQRENQYAENPGENQENENLDEPYQVRARGEVKARVWYDGYGECKLKSEKTVLTGRRLRTVYLETPWKTFTLKGSKDNDYSLYAKKITKKYLNTPVGSIGLCIQTMQEQSKKIKEYQESDAVSIARERAMKTLKQRLGKSQRIIDSKVEVLSAPSDPILRVKVSVETIENIVVAQPINISENGN